MYRSKQAQNINALKQICASLIYPHITSCQTVWGATHRSSCIPSCVAQKRSVRTISRIKRFEHTHKGFADLKLLKLSEINVYCRLHVFECLNIVGYLVLK